MWGGCFNGRRPMQFLAPSFRCNLSSMAMLVGALWSWFGGKSSASGSKKA